MLATAGVWLMTGAAPSGFGIGEMLGLACAISYSIDIIVLNMLITPQSVSRLTAGQFLVVGLINIIACSFLPGGPGALAHPARLILIPQIGVNVALMTLFPTLAAFGLQFRFQPRIDASRAAMIYLMEPIFASAFAMVITGRGLGSLALLGGGLIVAANLLVELVSARIPATPVMD
jgi:drug/metabolite transporter (DMT)-like permease